MAYVEDKTIHDADSHVMEMPTTITEYMSKDTQAKFEPYVRYKDPAWIDEIVRSTTTDLRPVNQMRWRALPPVPTTA